SRVTMRHFIGSLWMARRSASRAIDSFGNDISKRIRPGLTLATHHSGEPLPEPIRVSAGFLVMARSGKIVIQTLPPRRMCRFIAIRAASIWRLGTYAGSSAWIPDSPKDTLVPPLAIPSRVGWCGLRKPLGGLRGMNMMSALLRLHRLGGCRGGAVGGKRRLGGRLTRGHLGRRGTAGLGAAGGGT